MTEQTIELIATILETAMLICFGFSWPINLFKNYKAATAKSTSIFFILLILTGYVAGIASKFVAHKYTTGMQIFVLVVYFINFIMVFANLLVYFRNKRLDKQK